MLEPLQILGSKKGEINVVHTNMRKLLLSHSVAEKIVLWVPNLVHMRVGRSRVREVIVESTHVVTLEPTHSQCRSGERMNMLFKGGESIKSGISQNHDFLEVVQGDKIYLLK